MVVLITTDSNIWRYAGNQLVATKAVPMAAIKNDTSSHSASPPQTNTMPCASVNMGWPGLMRPAARLPAPT